MLTRLWTLIRTRPVLTAAVVAALAMGAGAVVFLAPDSWSLVRRVMTGLFAGAWFALLLVGGRVLLAGGSEDEY